MDQWDASDVVFPGHLRSFSSATGYGFVHNQELQEKFGRPLAMSGGSRGAFGAFVVCLLGGIPEGEI